MRRTSKEKSQGENKGLKGKQKARRKRKSKDEKYRVEKVEFRLRYAKSLGVI